MNETNFKASNINLENRAIATVTGVIQVDGFNDNEIRCQTCKGNLSIQGEELHIEALNLSSGEMCVKGNIVAFVYSEKTSAKGIFKSLFHD